MVNAKRQNSDFIVFYTANDAKVFELLPLDGE